MLLNAVTFCLAAVAVLASPLPPDEPGSLEARASTCEPDTAGKKFQSVLTPYPTLGRRTLTSNNTAQN